MKKDFLIVDLIDDPMFASGGFDLLSDIISTVRDAVSAGLITTVTVEEFDEDISELTGNDLEDYIQELWDNI